MTRIVGLIRGTGDQRDNRNRRYRRQVEAYCAPRWEDPAEIIEAQDGMAFLVEGTPGHILRSLSPGTRCVVPSFAHLADTIAELRTGIPAVLGLGVELHVADLGPVETYMPALRRAWEAAETLEAALAAEKAARSADSETFAQLFDEHTRSVSAHFARQYGFPASGVQPYAVPDEVKEALPEPVAETNGVAKADLKLVGEYVKGRRTAPGTGHTQRQAAEQAAHLLQKSVDSSAVSRAEHGENQSVLAALIETYAPELVLPKDLEGTIDPMLYATLKVRAAQAHDAAVFAAQVAEAEKPNGKAETNPFEDATKLQAGIGDAAAQGLPQEDRA